MDGDAARRHQASSLTTALRQVGEVAYRGGKLADLSDLNVDELERLARSRARDDDSSKARNYAKLVLSLHELNRAYGVGGTQDAPAVPLQNRADSPPAQRAAARQPPAPQPAPARVTDETQRVVLYQVPEPVVVSQTQKWWSGSWLTHWHRCSWLLATVLAVVLQTLGKLLPYTLAASFLTSVLLMASFTIAYPFTALRHLVALLSWTPAVLRSLEHSFAKPFDVGTAMVHEWLEHFTFMTSQPHVPEAPPQPGDSHGTQSAAFVGTSQIHSGLDLLYLPNGTDIERAYTLGATAVIAFVAGRRLL